MADGKPEGDAGTVIAAPSPTRSGGEGSSAGPDRASGRSPDRPGDRVKIYYLNDQGIWDLHGTGIVRLESLCVRSVRCTAHADKPRTAGTPAAREGSVQARQREREGGGRGCGAGRGRAGRGAPSVAPTRSCLDAYQPRGARWAAALWRPALDPSPVPRPRARRALPSRRRPPLGRLVLSGAQSSLSLHLFVYLAARFLSLLFPILSFTSRHPSPSCFASPPSPPSVCRRLVPFRW